MLAVLQRYLVFLLGLCKLWLILDSIKGVLILLHFLRDTLRVQSKNQN